MKNQIIQRICGTLLSTVIIMSIVACSLRFIPNGRPLEPIKLVEAPMYPIFLSLISWIKSIDWSKGGYHPRFKPPE